MRNTIFGALVLSLVVFACSKYGQKVRVTDVQKKEVIVLKNESAEDPVYSIRIRCRGHLDGKARVSLMLNGNPYKSEEIEGKTNFRWGGDWYSDIAEIRYEPTDVESGELVFDYRFSVIK